MGEMKAKFDKIMANFIEDNKNVKSNSNTYQNDCKY